MTHRPTHLIGAILCLILSTSCGNKAPETQDSAAVPASETEISTAATEPTKALFPGYDTSGKDTMKLESGLQCIMIEEGTGANPKTGSQVTVHYTGYLENGTKFDSSVDRSEPLKFVLGRGMVIQGWEEGIALLKKGGKARLIVPQELGYGKTGYPPVIPPLATLIFDVELIDFN